MSSKKSGFTLIEIIIVLGIAAVIFSAGIAPLLFTVRTLGEARDQFTADDLERAVFNRIVQDIREASKVSSTSPVTVMKSEELSDRPRDALIVWTTTPAYAGTYMGNAVWAIAKPKITDHSAKNGLCRWIMSNDVHPETELADLLAEHEHQQMIPDVLGMTIEMMRLSEWEEDYIGGVPTAVRVVFEYEDRESVHEAWFPNS